jgi:hypothetical protein
MFGVVQSERTVTGKASCEQQLYTGSIPPQARQLAHAVRSHWAVAMFCGWIRQVKRAASRLAGGSPATVIRIANSGLGFLLFDAIALRLGLALTVSAKPPSAFDSEAVNRLNA